MRLPKEYIILEIIPTSSNKENGFIAQIQALKVITLINILTTRQSSEMNIS